MSIPALVNDTQIENALRVLRDGGMVLVADDEDRENEGDLVMAAEFIRPEDVAFMVRHTGGILTVPMSEERLRDLHLAQMVEQNTEVNRTAFTVSVDYRHGTRSGVSAEDRAKTIRALVDPKSRPEDFARPGHVFPLRYREGGVLKRAGHTEASIDLCKLAGLQPAAVISELVLEDGSMARKGDLESFALQYKIPLVTVADLIRYRHKREKLIKRISEARIPTEFGAFTAHVYESYLDNSHHVALVRGDISNCDNTLVRVHSECLTGDVFGSRRCDCGSQLHYALQQISESEAGVLVYLRGHEGRGIGLAHKLRAYTLQDEGKDTVDANLELGLPVDSREYGIGAQILVDLGVSSMRLMTNNPAKYGGLEGYDLTIVERIPITPEIHADNENYLKCKKERLGHLIQMNELAKP